MQGHFLYRRKKSLLPVDLRPPKDLDKESVLLIDHPPREDPGKDALVS